MMRITDTVKHLLIINVIFWIATLVFRERGIDLITYLGLFFTDNPNFGFWQPITSMFMHSPVSPSHLLFNMLTLWIFGTRLEMEWGSGKFLAFYILSGLGAGLLHTLINYYGVYSNVNELVNAGISKVEIFNALNAGPYYYSPDWESVLTIKEISTLLKSYNVPAIGASGAIYGVMIAFALSYPHEKLMLLFPPIPIKAMYLVGGLLTYDFLAGFLQDAGLFREGNIAHFAHIGGALTGFLLMWYFNKTKFNKNRWD